MGWGTIITYSSFSMCPHLSIKYIFVVCVCDSINLLDFLLFFFTFYLMMNLLGVLKEFNRDSVWFDYFILPDDHPWRDFQALVKSSANIKMTIDNYENEPASGENE